MTPSRSKKFVPALLAGLLGAAALAATSRAFDWTFASGKTETRNVPIVVNDAPVARDTRLTTSFAPVVKRAAPSVVNIFTTKTVKNPRPDMTPFFQDPFFRRFFGDRFGDDSPGRMPRELKQRSLGSGVIVTADGYILTNDHVVDGADEIQVSLNKDNKQFTAKVVGRDPKTDIAVLKIDGKDLPFVTFADSDKIEVGDLALAIGNPFGVGQTVTLGIVSATGRGGMGIEDYEDFIQTDAAINPGNSGGALVDAEGRLLGVNTAILSRSGGNQGIGFAVPANLARDVMEQLIKGGKVERGYLGVAIQDLNPDLAKQFNAPETGGALVGEVTEKSAAAEAGLKSGDVIVAFNGKPVKDSRNLKLMVGRTAPGSAVDVKVLRDGKEKTFTVKLKESPDQKVAAATGGPSADDGEALKGVGVTDLTDEARRQYNIPPHVRGAVIFEVDPNSVAYEAGLRPGDVLQEVNRKPIRDAEEAVAATSNVKEKKTLVRVWSRGGSRYVVVDESKAS